MYRREFAKPKQTQQTARGSLGGFVGIVLVLVILAKHGPIIQSHRIVPELIVFQERQRTDDPG